MLNLKVKITGNVGDLLREERRAGARSITNAMRDAASQLKADWRSQVSGAQLGGRLANTIRGEAYPRSGFSANAAALVYTRAPKIIGAFEQGTVIRRERGYWLAIPLPAAGKAGRRKMTPGAWEAKTGRQLRSVFRGGQRSGLLVDDGKKAPGNVMVRRKTRGGYKLSAPTTFRNRTVPIFLLVPQVTLRKRLNLYAAAGRVANTLPQRIVSGWRSP